MENSDFTWTTENLNKSQLKIGIYYLILENYRMSSIKLKSLRNLIFEKLIIW